MLDKLTPAEKRVAELRATGMLVKEITFRLLRSQKTIEVHLWSIYRKLKVHNLKELQKAVKAEQVLCSEAQ